MSICVVLAPRLHAQDAPVNLFKVAVEQPVQIRQRIEKVPIDGLVSGVPTQLSITIESETLPPVDEIAIMKSCSCFSAKIESKSSLDGKPQLLLTLVTIPSENGFFEKLSLFRKSDARHDGSGDGPQYDGKRSLVNFEFIGRATDPISIQVSETSAPRPNEFRTITIRPAVGRVTIIPESLVLSSDYLELEKLESDSNGTFTFRCASRTASDEKIEPNVNGRFSVDVHCDYFFEGFAKKIPYEVELQFWNNYSIRIVPPRLLVSKGDADDSLSFSVVDTRGFAFDENTNPYRFRFATDGGTVDPVEVLTFKKVSERRWSFSVVAPILVGQNSTLLLQLLDKEDLENAPARATARIYLD